MKILRWILSHTFLIVLIVLVIYGYMFWGNLLGRDTPAGKAVAYLSNEFVVVEEFVNAVRAKQAELKAGNIQDTELSDQAARDSDDSTTGGPTDSLAVEEAGLPVVEQESSSEAVKDGALETVASDRGVADSELDTKAMAVPVKEDMAAQDLSAQDVSAQDVSTQDVSTQDRALQGIATHATGSQGEIQTAPVQADMMPQAAEQPAVEQRSDELAAQAQSEAVPAGQQADQQHSVANMNTANVSGEFVSPEIEKQLDNVDQSGRVIDQSEKMTVVRDTWITARKSFYQRKYELSEQSYLDVINNTTDNHDAYGELGNVYFNQGKHEQAAAAYFEAAAILVRKGQVNRAKSLIGLLRHLDQTKASELQQLIETTAS